jgi:hypothetical protein
VQNMINEHLNGTDAECSRCTRESRTVSQILHPPWKPSVAGEALYAGPDS